MALFRVVGLLISSSNNNNSNNNSNNNNNSNSSSNSSLTHSLRSCPCVQLHQLQSRLMIILLLQTFLENLRTHPLHQLLLEVIMWETSSKINIIRISNNNNNNNNYLINYLNNHNNNYLINYLNNLANTNNTDMSAETTTVDATSITSNTGSSSVSVRLKV